MTDTAKGTVRPPHRTLSASNFLRTMYKKKSSDVLSLSLPGRKPDEKQPFASLKSCLSSGNLTGTAIRKNVSFHNVEIHEHLRTLGDNPSVSSGPALSVAWTTVNEMKLSVDEYEEHRPPRRNRCSLTVPRCIREDMLRHEGVSRQEMEAANRQTIKIKQNRHQSARSSNRTGADSAKTPFLVFSKIFKGSASSTDKQVEILMERAIRAEQMRQKQREAYLAAQEAQQRENELKAQHHLHHQQDHQTPGQSSEETCQNLSTAVVVAPPLTVAVLNEAKMESPPAAALPGVTQTKEESSSSSFFLPAALVGVTDGSTDETAEDWEF